jgi:hypothetical protein
MGAANLIFYLFMFTFLAALAYAGWQVFKTNESQERHGDDKKALTHRLEREQAEVETARAKQADEGGPTGPYEDDTRERHQRLAERQAEAEEQRKRHTGAASPEQQAEGERERERHSGVVNPS